MTPQIKNLFIWGGLLFFLFLIGFSGCGSYNNMVTMDEAVTANWQQVENHTVLILNLRDVFFQKNYIRIPLRQLQGA